VLVFQYLDDVFGVHDDEAVLGSFTRQLGEHIKGLGFFLSVSQCVFGPVSEVLWLGKWIRCVDGRVVIQADQDQVVDAFVYGVWLCPVGGGRLVGWSEEMQRWWRWRRDGGRCPAGCEDDASGQDWPACHAPGSSFLWPWWFG